MNDKAIICQLPELTKIEGTDRLYSASVLGEYIIVTDEYQKGDIGLLFHSELVLDPKYLAANNLYRHSHLNKDQSKAGYMEDNGRVRCLRLRGHKSTALFMPLSSLRFIGDTTGLKPGHELDEFKKQSICTKYIRQTRNIGNSNKIKGLAKENIVPDFREHIDTDHLLRDLGRLPLGAMGLVTTKTHGCVEKSTIVETLEFGPKTIGEIVNLKIKCHIKGRDLINNQDVYVKISDWYFLKNDGEWFEIELENNQKLVITGNNPVWLPIEKCYRRVDELKESDTIFYNTQEE